MKKVLASILALALVLPFSLVFSGHKLCETKVEDGEIVHQKGSFYGIAWWWNLTIQRYSVITSSDMPIVNEIKTTAHEIGHWFSAPDHYDTVADGNSPYTLEEIHNQYPGKSFSATCIYGTEKDNLDVVKDLITCSGCKELIRENASYYGGAQ